MSVEQTEGKVKARCRCEGSGGRAAVVSATSNRVLLGCWGYREEEALRREALGKSRAVLNRGWLLGL